MKLKKIILRHLFTLIFLSGSLSLLAQSKFTISGYVNEKGSKEHLPGVSIYIPKLKTGTTTNNYGFYSLTLDADSVELIFSFVSYQPKSVKLKLDKNITLNMELSDIELEEVVVSAEHQKKISDEVRMSTIDIPVEQIKQIPALLGEKDVLKVLQLMPGVQKGSEGNSGFYVRGGGPDQNLIILDDATVYNAFHLFGFFSLFNGDALKSVELTKGGFPARYGGRLSSVLEMQMKDGNKEATHGEVSVGLISSRFTVEGPIIKDKCSFLLSGRRTYIDALIYPLLDKENKAGYYFYDMNAKLNYTVNDKNRLFLSGYFGKDKFYFKSIEDFTKSQFSASFGWGNATSTLRWNHIINEKTFSNTSFIFTNYLLDLNIEQKTANDVFSLRYFSGIRDFSLKYNIDYSPSPSHFVRTGLMVTHHLFTPSALVAKDSQYDLSPLNYRSKITALENGIFIEDDWRINTQWRANAGIRISHFNAEGKNYINPEPRLSLRYLIKEDLSVKASFATMNQYLHLLSNTGIGLPTDLWVPVTKHIQPQRSNQIAVGIAKDISSKDLTVSVEGYYKKMDHILGYKEGASFLTISNGTAQEKEVKWQSNVTSGQGWSYGAEFLIQRKVGKFSGWIGYTLSWTQLQFDSLNFGKKYYARYDRRHDFSFVGIYKIKENLTLSATWVYGTGNAITLPTSTYLGELHNPSQGTNPTTPNAVTNVQDYGEKNSFRMGAYHRFDIGLQFHKKLPKGLQTVEISLYNAYNRRNPFFYYVSQTTPDKSVLMQVSLFPILPSISYTFKF